MPEDRLAAVAAPPDRATAAELVGVAADKPDATSATAAGAVAS